MATHDESDRLSLRTEALAGRPDGAWWPRSRDLGEEIGDLFEVWPADAGWILRVLYSPPDWDDRPRAVRVPRGRIKTGCFPSDDTHELVLTMAQGARRHITVIPHDTAVEEARAILSSVGRD